MSTKLLKDLGIKLDWLMQQTQMQNMPGPSDQLRQRMIRIARGRHGIKPALNLSAAQVATAAKATNTEPTEAQKEAGNYRMGHIRLQGMNISIENPRGSARFGTRQDGSKWESKLAHHYGYIKGTESEADGDHIDVFIGPNPESNKVYVIDQYKLNGHFDEHKCMIGFDTQRDAVEGYLANYPRGWKGLGAVSEMTMPEFKYWMNYEDTSRPVVK